MGYGRTLGGRSLHSARDYEQERANLQDGINNSMKAYQEYIDDTLNDDTLSTSEKIEQLQAYKLAIQEEQKQYDAAFQHINDDEAQHYANNYGVSGAREAQEHLANEYCTFSNETEESASELSSQVDSYVEQNQDVYEMN